MKRYTIVDIAKMANVSKATVSKVMNNTDVVAESTREKIQKIIDDIGYRPNSVARGLSLKSSRIIGCIIPDMKQTFWIDLVCEIELFAAVHDYKLILSNSFSYKKKELVYMMLDSNVDGVLIVPSFSDSKESIELLEKYGTPHVVIIRGIGEFGNVSGVFSDFEKGTYLSANMLLADKNARLAHLSIPKTSITYKHRLGGLKKSLAEHNQTLDDIILREGDYTISCGYNVVSSLIKEKTVFNKLLCGNDHMAFGALRALQKNNINVPQDVELIGYDDLTLSAFSNPSLTTVTNPHKEIARASVTELISQINGSTAKKTFSIPPELIIRESTLKHF